jgi:hypothetical protein
MPGYKTEGESAFPHPRQEYKRTSMYKLLFLSMCLMPALFAGGCGRSRVLGRS